MKIEVSNAGKRFNRDWIFRNANFTFTTGNACAIAGPNGSGKSTFLQSIAGMLQLSEGHISFTQYNKPIAPEAAYRYLSFAAPYIEVVEEMTLTEFLHFHRQFKPFIDGCSINHIMAAVDLEKAAGKQIRYYSSGMKQRVKLAQAFFSATPVLLLDEPCSNLDKAGIRLYHQLIENYSRERLVIVSSNDEVEYGFCNTVISIADYKTTTPAPVF